MYIVGTFLSVVVKNKLLALTCFGYSLCIQITLCIMIIGFLLSIENFLHVYMAI